MKKVIIKFLTLALCCTFLSQLCTVFAWEENTEAVDLRIGVMSDAHAGTETTSYVTSALNAFNDVAGGAENLDGLALVGDMVYHANAQTLTDGVYEALYSAIDATNANTPRIYAMGNHEFPLNNALSDSMNATSIATFEEKTGQTAKYHTTFGDAESGLDYHFIAAGAKNYNGVYTAETEAWLMQEIDKAIAADSTNANDDGETFAVGVTPNSVKPVFLLLHHPIQNTVFSGGEVGYTEEFLAYLKTRPQVINLTGHWHVSAKRPETIWQDGFTVYQVPLLSNGYLGDYGLGDTGSIYIHQASMIDVKDNVVKIYKLDIDSGNYIGEPWVIDIPSIVTCKTNDNPSDDNDGYLYSADKRANAVAPAFPEDATVTAVASDGTASVSFKDLAVATETANQQDGFVYGYRVQLYADGELTATKNLSTKYYLESYVPASGTAMSTSFSDIQDDVYYTVKVLPLSPFAVGEPIETSFNTLVKTEEVSVNMNSSVLVEAESLTVGDEAYKLRMLEGASGGAVITNNLTASGSTYGASYTDEISFTVNVTEAGNYDFEAAFSDANNKLPEYVSWIHVYVDDTKIDSNWYGAGTKVSTYENSPLSSAPITVHQVQDVALTAETHTVKFVIQNAGSYKKYVPEIYIDYIKITSDGYIPPVNIPDEPYQIEMENYSTSTGTSSYCEGGAYAKAVNDGTGAGVPILVNVYVEKTGWYDIEAAIAYQNAAEYWSTTKVFLDSTSNTALISNAKYSSTTVLSTYENSPNSSYPMKVYQKQYVELTEGNHTFIITISKPSKLTYPNMQFDYLKISPYNYVAPVDYEGDVPLLLEMENYFEEKGTSTYCSGGAYAKATDDGSHSGRTTTVRINVEKAGKYDIQAALAYQSAAEYWSTTQIYLDSTSTTALIRNAKYSTTSVVSTYENSPNASYPIKVYEIQDVELTAGVHSLIITIDKPSQVAYPNMQFDYIKLTPEGYGVDAYSYENGTASAKVYYDEALTGKSIIAVYDADMKLLGINCGDITAKPYADISTLITKGIARYIKVFAWDNLTDVNPIAISKEYTIQ